MSEYSRKPRPRIHLLLPGTLIVGAIASGQSLNVDFGSNTTFPIPSGAYGAAVDQQGVWNAAASGAAGQALVDVNGLASGVTLTEVGSVGDFEDDDPTTVGDDQSLLDDLLHVDAAGAASTITFAGLSDDTYIVVTYAWAPDDPSGHCSDVDVLGSLDGPQVVCGVWPGFHIQGVTYALHTVEVTSGTITVTIDASIGSDFGSVNGIQILPCSSNGTCYCFGNLGTCPGGAVGAAGHGCPNTNPNGRGARLMSLGTAQITNDSFRVRITGAPPNKPGILFLGYNPLNVSVLPDSAGLLCVSPVLRGYVFFSDGTGNATQDDFRNSPFGAEIDPKEGTVFYQYWYRDPSNPLANPGPNAAFNFSNGIAVNWAP